MAGEVVALYGALRAAWSALTPVLEALELVDTVASLRDRFRDRRFTNSVVTKARQALGDRDDIDAAAARRLLGDEMFVTFAADPDNATRRAALSDHVRQRDGLGGVIGPGCDENAVFTELATAFVAATFEACMSPAQRLLAAQLDVADETALHILNTALDLHPKVNHANTQLAEVLQRLRVEVRDLLVDEPFLAQDVDLTTFLMASDVTEGRIPPYVSRDVDPRLDELLADACGDGTGFVAVAGDTKSGKTRCALEALIRVTPLHLVYRVRRSRHRDTISALINALAVEPPHQPWVVLVDDLYYHLAGGAELAPAARRAAHIDPPGLIIATTDTRTLTPIKALRLVQGPNDDDLQLIRTRQVTLPSVTTPAEQARAIATLGPQLAGGQIDADDLAHFPERLAAIPELLDRIDDARHRPSSSNRFTLILAAVRLTLAQAFQAIDVIDVREYAKCIHRYLEAHERTAISLSDAALNEAEEWATYRVGAAYSLFVPVVGTDDTVEVLDAAVRHLASTAIDPRFGPCGPANPAEAIHFGETAYLLHNLPAAKYWMSQAAAAGHPAAMHNLGVLLMEGGDRAGAEDWFQQAAEAGHVPAMSNIGLLLMEDGNRAGAEDWFRQAVEAGDAVAMTNLGLLLLEGGDRAGAKDWYRRAAEAVEAGAMFNLGALLMENGDRAGAEGWFRRAAGAGDAIAMSNLGALLTDRGDLEGAEDWLRRAVKAGDIDAMHNLALVREERGDHEGAEDWYRRAAEAGQTAAMSNLGRLLYKRGDPNGEDWFRRAAAVGNADAMHNLALVLGRRGDHEVPRTGTDKQSMRATPPP